MNNNYDGMTSKIKSKFKYQLELKERDKTLIKF